MNNNRHIIALLTTLLLTVALPACQNDGDIGFLFGEWTMTQMSVDGTPATIPGQGCVWAFQTDIVSIRILKAGNEVDQYWGTWAIDEDAKTFTLDFTHGIDPGDLPAPPHLHMTDQAPMLMHIDSQSAKHLTLTYIDPMGQSLIYTLSKQW